MLSLHGPCTVIIRTSHVSILSLYGMEPAFDFLQTPMFFRHSIRNSIFHAHVQMHVFHSDQDLSHAFRGFASPAQTAQTTNEHRNQIHIQGCYIYIYIYICVHESAMDVSILWKGTIPFESGSQYKYYTHIYIGESLADEVLRPQPRTLKLQTKHRNQIHVQGCYIYIYIYIYMRARSCNGCLHFVGSNDSVREWKQRQG
jgi:hypothetical protein